MNETTIRQMFEGYAEIAAKALAEGKRVTFQEEMTIGGTVLLVCRISPSKDAEQVRGPNSA